MRIRGKMLQACVAMFLIMCLLMGCGQNASSQINIATKAEAIEFSWWGNDPRHLYTMEGVNLFKSQNPDIDVTCRYGIWNGFETRTRIQMNSHTEADVMQINFSWLQEYSPEGEGYYDLLQLADYIDLSNFTENDLEFGMVDGKLNALPIAYNSTIIFYNQDIYEKYGLQIPKTWDDLFAAATVMRKDGIYPIGAVKKHVFLLLIAYYEQTTGKNVFGDDGSFLLQEAEVALMMDFYNKLIQEKVLLPIDQFDRSFLASGKLAGSMFWISDISNYCSSIEECGTPVLGTYLKVQEENSITGWYKKPATMYAISANTDHPEASAKLLNYLLNDSQMAVLQGTEKGIPVSKSAYQAAETAGLIEGYSAQADLQMIEAGSSLRIMLPAMEQEDFIDQFKASSDLYLYGKESLEDAVAQFLQGIQ